MNKKLNIWLSRAIERSAGILYGEINPEHYRAFLKSVRCYKDLNDTYLHIARLKKPSFFVLHHDVHTNPERLLKIAKLEHSLGWRSNFFIRPSKELLDMKMAKQLWDMDHDLGLLYDCLDAAHLEHNEHSFRSIEERAWLRYQNILLTNLDFKINVCAPYNRPLGIDNRLLWKVKNYRKMEIRCDTDMDLRDKEIVYFKIQGRKVDYLMRQTDGDYREIDPRIKIYGVKDLGYKLKRGKMVDRIVVRFSWH
ncbi:MAG: hypothetical protein LHW63_05155 [Candidatus Cloacimonetes bacterium]|jgi:hypothetical protein|nr:hypothetical protein [Candidatus Cloacimonadota bacterium]MDD3752180.1 hypothetical protein [Tissierellia bacterium]